MNNKRRFLFLDVGLETNYQLVSKIQQGLTELGAAVEEMVLDGNYELVLDQLEEGAIPIVLKI